MEKKLNGVLKSLSIALDASPFSLALSSDIASLAEQFKASLDFICVEDENFIKLSEHPLAKPISPFAIGKKALSKDTVEQMLRSQISAAKNAMDLAVKGKNIEHELIIKRGNVIQEILASSEETDLLVVGWSGWKTANYYGSSTVNAMLKRSTEVLCKDKLGSSVKKIILESKVSTLILRRVLSEISKISYITDLKTPKKEKVEFVCAFIKAVQNVINKNNKKENEKKISFKIFVPEGSNVEQVKEDTNLISNEYGIKTEIIKLPHYQKEDTRQIIKDFIKPDMNTILAIKDETELHKEIFRDAELINDIHASIISVKDSRAI